MLSKKIFYSLLILSFYSVNGSEAQVLPRDTEQSKQEAESKAAADSKQAKEVVELNEMEAKIAASLATLAISGKYTQVKLCCSDKTTLREFIDALTELTEDFEYPNTDEALDYYTQDTCMIIKFTEPLSKEEIQDLIDGVNEETELKCYIYDKNIEIPEDTVIIDLQK